MVKVIMQWAELGSDRWHSIGSFRKIEDAVMEASAFLAARINLKIQSAVRVRVGYDGNYGTVFRASTRLPQGYIEFIRKQSLGGPTCRHVEEGDEVYCVTCARRWGVTDEITCKEKTNDN